MFESPNSICKHELTDDKVQLNKLWAFLHNSWEISLYVDCIHNIANDPIVF